MSSVVLVGMPGAGKSTVGVLLAKELALNFVDTDLLIQLYLHQTLQEYLDEHGYLALREVEEKIILENLFVDSVVATGGSAVYGKYGMEKLKKAGVVVYLTCTREELMSRIQNYDTRGIARRPDQSFDELLDERGELYLKYADLTIETDGKTPEQIVRELVAKLPTEEER